MTSQHQPLSHRTRTLDGKRVEWAGRCACGWQSRWESRSLYATENVANHIADNRGPASLRVVP